MAKTFRRTIEWPVGGVVRRFAFQSQPPYTCPDALNVRPDATFDDRQRGGSRPGIEKALSTQLGSGADVNLLSEIRWSNSGTLTTELVAASNGTLYKSAVGASTFSTVTAAGNALDTGRQLTAAPFLQKLYIAGDNQTNENITVYDPSAGSHNQISASAGTAPTKCRILLTAFDRLFAAEDTDNPHLWYASQQGDATDWDYTAIGAHAAIQATTTGGPGQLGDPIKALIRHANQCVIFGCSRSMWVLRGDPGAGGRFSNLSDEVGILGRHAYCYTADKWLFWLSQDGIYAMPPGCGSIPISVSRERLPEELRNLNPASYNISMSYDFFARGIHLFLTKTSGSDGTGHWFIDVATTMGQNPVASASFWPVSMPTGIEPIVSFSREDGTSDQSLVMMGGTDGYVRRFALDANDDDGTSFSSYCTMGPFMLGRGLIEGGKLMEMAVVTAQSSGDVDVDVHVGNSAWEAYNASALETHQFNSTGRHPNTRLRGRGSAAFLKFKNGETDAHWALEQAEVVTGLSGRVKA